MITFIDDLFIGGNVKDLGTIIYSLRRKIPVFNLYCICLYYGERSRVEVFSSRQLFSKRNETKEIAIAGVAYGREEAVSLLHYMVQEAVKEGKNIKDPKSWSFWEAQE